MEPDSDGPPPGPPRLRRQNARILNWRPCLLYVFDPRRCLVAAPPGRPALFAEDYRAESYAEDRPLPPPLVWVRVSTENPAIVDFFAGRRVCTALMFGAGR